MFFFGAFNVLLFRFEAGVFPASAQARLEFPLEMSGYKKSGEDKMIEKYIVNTDKPYYSIVEVQLWTAVYFDSDKNGMIDERKSVETAVRNIKNAIDCKIWDAGIVKTRLNQNYISPAEVLSEFERKVLIGKGTLEED